jgi:hypothetical protein
MRTGTDYTSGLQGTRGSLRLLMGSHTISLHMSGVCGMLSPT